MVKSHRTFTGIKAQEEAKGHNLNASRSTRLTTKIKTKEDRLNYYISPIMQISIFCIGRGVIEVLSSIRFFNMPTQCNSDLLTTSD